VYILRKEVEAHFPYGRKSVCLCYASETLIEAEVWQL
jgi:hypothetical protein